MITFPESLPRPSQNYRVNIANSAVRSSMDSGRVRQRRRFTNSNNEILVRWDFTDEEFQLFESFVFFALDGGTSWFEVQLLSGGGITTHKARFQEGKYSATYKTFFGWSVSATLDVESINRADSDIFLLYKEVADELSYEELVDVIGNIEPVLEQMEKV